MSYSLGEVTARAKDWWRGGVIYQIYPRSFQDSNDDGIGDLKGITQRLPYIASLGVDAIWLSPFFTSPMKDFGYDVSDYCDVDPMFGNLSDFDEMVKEAHRLGLKVMIDQVLSHSSAEHVWFQESRQSRDNPKADWYVWADPKADGTPPNNWLSVFGGSAWQWEARRQQYYLHNFLISQPDFNFHNPDVQEALLAACRFWLDRGVDGFRLDTINFYFHDRQLRSNPPLPPHERNSAIAPAVNPYNHQNHLYDKNQPENLAFLKRLRALCESYPTAACVGEVGDAQHGLEIMEDYTSGSGLMQMCYSFEFLTGHRFDAEFFYETLGLVMSKVPNGWPCFSFSNHDTVRHASRWHLDAKGQQMALALQLAMRGSVCLYQGEELGLGEGEIEFDDLQDPYGIEFWPEFKGRDGCRTPMVWDNLSKGQNCGFNQSDSKPWLPIPREHRGLAVATQDSQQGSLLNFYRHLIPLRRNYQSLRLGSAKISKIGEHGLLIERQLGQERLLLAFQFTPEEFHLELAAGENWHVIALDCLESKKIIPPQKDQLVNSKLVWTGPGFVWLKQRL